MIKMGETHIKNIVLIGMPGAGKSTVGVLLAKAIGYDFIDTDILLGRQIGHTLQDFIDKYGIDEFLRAEEKAAMYLQCANTVIATGGSMVLSDVAMKHLKSEATILWLDISLEEIKRRLGNIQTRGIAMGSGQTIDDIYAHRQPLYAKYSDIRISGQGLELDIEATVREIVQHIV